MFKENVRSEMKYQGISAKELAARANISINTLNMYIGHRRSIPAADIALRIAKVLNVTVEDLFSQTRLSNNSADSNLSNPISYVSEPESHYGAFNSENNNSVNRKKMIGEIEDILLKLNPAQLEAFKDIAKAYYRGTTPNKKS